MTLSQTVPWCSHKVLVILFRF